MEIRRARALELSELYRIQLQALYARSGMAPLWPSFNLRVDANQVDLRPAGVDVLEMNGSVEAVSPGDAAISGRKRPEDLRFLLEGWHGTLLRIERAGERIGYAGLARAEVVGRQSDQSEFTTPLTLLMPSLRSCHGWRRGRRST